MYSCAFNRTISSNISYVLLDCLATSVILFPMVVSPFSLLISRSTLLRFRIHRLLSIYTLFNCTSLNQLYVNVTGGRRGAFQVGKGCSVETMNKTSRNS